MQLYLIRHGIAIDRSSSVAEEDRPLTLQGQEKTKAIVERLKGLGIKFDRLLSSPLCRAKETAEILQQAGLVKTLEIWDGLRPGEPLQAWIDWSIAEAISPEHQIALVGHEPDLSYWAEQLLWGTFGLEMAGHLQLKKAGIMGLTLPDVAPFLGQGQLFWLTPPRFLL